VEGRRRRQIAPRLTQHRHQERHAQEHPDRDEHEIEHVEVGGDEAVRGHQHQIGRQDREPVLASRRGQGQKLAQAHERDQGEHRHGRLPARQQRAGQHRHHHPPAADAQAQLDIGLLRFEDRQHGGDDRRDAQQGHHAGQAPQQGGRLIGQKLTNVVEDRHARPIRDTQGIA
jgi:hypothetical protein